ncbi:mechanosensitive ion channel family protein [Tsuneonella mangrovi]|uniref:mechanosensitive ion channel family protein n=1 Tax=Tsuneonella mangrovi TaxID=1982042 RepID=UPI000BA223A7|nr:mechanosensitive ion channel domain-containing protein [Tsuneonella mangrovi]
MFRELDLTRYTLDLPALIHAVSYVVLAVAASLLIHSAVFALLRRIAARTETGADDLVVAKLHAPSRWAILAVGISLVAQVDSWVAYFWLGVSKFVVPALLGWMAFAIVRAFALVLDIRAEAQEELAAARSQRTRIAILSRTATFIIVFITVGLMLLGIPGVRQVGVTLMASAGLAALAVGAAAQPALKSLIAGLQMAITEPVRIGDLVVVDGFTGRIEEIRMSFVVVRMWDERAAIVPTSRLLDTSFENWSRVSEKLSGPVFLHLDPATEVAPIRAEFERFLEQQPEWDHRMGTLVMTEAHPESIELRLGMSSNSIGDLFALRSRVREHMLDWLRREMPDALLRHRLEVEAANARVRP